MEYALQNHGSPQRRIPRFRRDDQPRPGGGRALAGNRRDRTVGGKAGRRARRRPERERVALLAEVVRSLDPRDKDNFTKDGKPRTEVLKADERIGFPVSAALRDRALDLIGSMS